MTDAEKIQMVQALVNDEEATDALVNVYLCAAADAIQHRRYPFGIPDGVSLDERYDYLQVRLAQRYFLRRGGEGEDAHNENGINRSYGSVNDEDLLMEVVPLLKVI